MAYEALYRQYRPQTFLEVVGQEHITTILKNQVLSGRPAHAYLFVGSRGTGKTSTARILARAVNCLSPDGGEPCGVCDACKVMESAHIDIVEMDAATNAGVDDARSLIEKARFMPLQLPKKVYIIDEVHALSSAAFSALLKTLEEPPAHVMFILATTEPQKVPATIVSRCQRMDFHRLSLVTMVSCIKGILKKAGVTMEDEGISTIARTAEGGMRDALSLADQCIAFCGDHVSASDVYSVLGSMEADFLFEAADALLGYDPARALALLDKVVADGRDLSVFMRDFTAHFRALLLAKLCGACSDLLDCTDDAMRRYLKQVEPCSDIRLLRASEALLKAQMNARMVDMPRVLFEGALVRIARVEEEEKSLEELTARIEQLETKLARLAAEPRAYAQPTHSAAGEPGRGEEPPRPADESSSRRAEGPHPAAEPDAAPAASAKPAVPSASPAAAQTDAAALWKKLLAALQERDRMLHILAMSGKASSIEGNALVVGFDSETKLRAVTMADKAALLNELLGAIAPGLTLRAVPASKTPSSSDLAQKAQSLFGMDVEVVD